MKLSPVAERWVTIVIEQCEEREEETNSFAAEVHKLFDGQNNGVCIYALATLVAHLKAELMSTGQITEKEFWEGFSVLVTAAVESREEKKDLH